MPNIGSAYNQHLTKTGLNHHVQGHINVTMLCGKQTQIHHLEQLISSYTQQSKIPQKTWEKVLNRSTDALTVISNCSSSWAKSIPIQHFHLKFYTTDPSLFFVLLPPIIRKIPGQSRT
ncbi:hypothetical protein J3458_009375 [Metarhizium acridum]|uniref:uncharacterized protein n=1 Tax=Metarhizium acridum TaxID=92637 RepID=UPI001C6CD68E|nr:hypothetical protein J3458_009375 [Metarhizium acridum]